MRKRCHGQAVCPRAFGVATANLLTRSEPSHGGSCLHDMAPACTCLNPSSSSLSLSPKRSLSADIDRTNAEQDTVEWGSLFVGCAGGGDSLITLPVEKDAVDPASHDSYRHGNEACLPSRGCVSLVTKAAAVATSICA